MTDFIKLSNLVDDTFKVEKVWGYKWKKWDDDEKKMLVSDIYKEGYRKVYEVETNKGKLDLGSGQIGSLLEAVFKNGEANLNGVTFKVKSNGKTGMDIRYYFDVDWTLKNVAKLPDAELNGDISDEDIPF